MGNESFDVQIVLFLDKYDTFGSYFSFVNVVNNIMYLNSVECLSSVGFEKCVGRKWSSSLEFFLVQFGIGKTHLVEYREGLDWA